MEKQKIEAIYPLTFMQHALLFHSLSEEEDQGFLHVETTLRGNLNDQWLRQAWQKIFERHAVFRTSIHWEKIEKPMQVVHPKASLDIEVLDWSKLRVEKQNQELKSFKDRDKAKGLDLSKVPVSRIAVIKLGDEHYLMLWSCHHILLDGWSASIIIKDLFTYYKSFSEDKPLYLEPVPSFKTYIKWVQSEDTSKAKAFWTKALKGFTTPTLLAQQAMPGDVSQVKLAKQTIILDDLMTEQIQSFTKKNRLTINTFLQGVWSMLIGRFFQTSDIAFGTTVSVRSEVIPNMQLMAGLFTNMLPVRVKINTDIPLTDWFRLLQQEQVEARDFQYVTIDQIISWSKCPAHLPLFDSLLVVENFPWQKIESGSVSVLDFKGGITTNYPLTVVVKPGPGFEFIFRYDESRISKVTISWFLENLTRLIVEITTKPQLKSVDVLNVIKQGPEVRNKGVLNGTSVKTGGTDKITPYVPPKSSMELQLIKIWELIFGRQRIGIKENFFEIGGRSLLAVRMFAQIEKKLGINLPPVTLLQHPTIEALAKVLTKDDNQTAWSSVVPIRTSGKRLPLFCIHAGGGHVFFYNTFAQYLGPDQPVYAIQPVGLDGLESYHKSIEEMAAHYINEIKSIQPQEPYALLGTCFSTAVSLEMARQLKAAGEEIALLAIVDSIPERSEVLASSFERKPISRMMALVQQGAWQEVRKKFTGRVLRMKKKWVFKYGSQQAQNLLTIQDALKTLYYNYSWEPYSGKVTLFIREYKTKRDHKKDYYITEWKDIALGGIEVFEVEGNHHTLFEEPEVQGLAIQIGDYMVKTLQQISQR